MSLNVGRVLRKLYKRLQAAISNLKGMFVFKVLRARSCNGIGTTVIIRILDCDLSVIM